MEVGWPRAKTARRTAQTKVAITGYGKTEKEQEDTTKDLQDMEKNKESCQRAPEMEKSHRLMF